MAALFNKRLLLKVVSFISVIRGYNILVLVLAQYLTAMFILARDKPLWEVLFDPNLFFLVLASATAIAAGYIINNFYDKEKDLINRPHKTMLDRFVSQRTKLSVYFILNLLSIFFASYVSFRTVVFFSCYIFMIWLYSHRIKRLLFLGNIMSTILIITPLFAIFIYYKNFDTVIFVHAFFLCILVIMKELVKDLQNLKGDILQGYRTIPAVYGENLSKKILAGLILLSLLPVYFLIFRFEIGHMDLFFKAAVAFLFVFLFVLFFVKARWQYLFLYNLLKLIIVGGVIGILLIDINTLVNRVF